MFHTIRIQYQQCKVKTWIHHHLQDDGIESQRYRGRYQQTLYNIDTISYRDDMWGLTGATVYTEKMKYVVLQQQFH